MLAFFLNRRKRCLLKAPAPHETLKRIAAFLGVIFSLHISAMMYFEEMPFFDSVWLTATTIVTVGYGDLSAKTVPGRLSTMILLYFCGIYVIADAASRVIAWRQYKMERKLTGQWRWNMKDHIVIIGSPRCHAEQFFGRLAKEIEMSMDHPEIILLTESFSGTLPESITSQNAVHYRGSGHTQAELEAVDISHARAVIILSDDETDIASDSKVLDIAYRLRETPDFSGHLVLELVNDENRERIQFIKNRIHVSTVRPARGYPEMLVRAIASPGSEEILENFFSEAGDEVCKIHLNTTLEETWSSVITRVVMDGAGIPIGYHGSGVNGAPTGVVSNPPSNEKISAKALYVVVGDRCQDASARINQLFQNPLLQAV